MTRARGVVVVTGASSGIGRASALALASAEYQVFAGVRSAEAGNDLRRAASGALTTILLDVTDPGAIAAAVAAVEPAVDPAAPAPRRFAGLFSNAGISVNAPLEFLSLDELRRQLDVNVVAQLALVQAFLPLLRRDAGRIVLTGSVAGFLALPMVGAYAISKHALEAMADVLRVELAPWGIEVALLEPGKVRTPIWEKGRRDAAAFLSGAPPALPALYGRRIDGVLRAAAWAERTAAPPEEVARAVLHAFGGRRPRARYLTGGGAHAQRAFATLPARLRDAVLARLLPP